MGSIALLVLSLGVAGCSSADDGISKQETIEQAVRQTIVAISKANLPVDTTLTVTTVPPTSAPFQDALPAESLLRALSAEYLAARAIEESIGFVWPSKGKALEFETRKSVAIYLAQTCLSDTEPTTSGFRDFAQKTLWWKETAEGKRIITEHLDQVLGRISQSSSRAKYFQRLIDSMSRGTAPAITPTADITPPLVTPVVQTTPPKIEPSGDPIDVEYECTRRYLNPSSTAEALLAIDMVSPVFNDFPAFFRESLIPNWENTANGSYVNWLNSPKAALTGGFLMWFCEENAGFADC